MRLHDEMIHFTMQWWVKLSLCLLRNIFFFMFPYLHIVCFWPNPDLICKLVFFSGHCKIILLLYIDALYIILACAVDSWSSPVRSAVYLLGQNVNVQISTRHHYPGVKLFINSCYVATVNSLSQATKYSIIDNYGWVKQNGNFVEHLSDTKHSHTHMQVFTRKPDKSRCFKIQALQGRQCCSVLLWCVPIHWGSRCPGVFYNFDSFLTGDTFCRQCNAVVCIVKCLLCAPSCSLCISPRFHSIVRSLCPVEALVQCRSLVFTSTQTKG